MSLPTEQVEQLRELTDNVSGCVAAAVARQIRQELLGEDLRRYQEENGAFTDEELAAARAAIFDRGAGTGAV